MHFLFVVELTSLNQTEVWISLRYEQGRENATPDYENNQMENFEQKVWLKAWIAPHLWLKYINKSL